MNTPPTDNHIAQLVLVLLQLSEGNYNQITVIDDLTVKFICTPDFPIILPKRIDCFCGAIGVQEYIADTSITYTYHYSPITETIATKS